ncbi:MAG: diguanylate cyclase [Halopseudomonas sp.]
MLLSPRIVIAVLIYLSVLLFDCSLPLGVAGGVPYVAFVMVGLWFSRPYVTVILAVLGSAGTLIGYFYSAPEGVHWMVLTNRGLAIFVIWVTAVLIIRHKIDTADLEQAATVFNEVAGGIIVTDARNIITKVNPGFSRITGFSPDEVIGKNPNMFQSGLQDKNFYRRMWRSISVTGAWHGEIWSKNRAGEIFPEKLSIVAIKDRKGAILKHIGLFQDISEQKNTEATLRKKSQILQLLHATAQHANSAKTTEAALQATLADICAYTGWPVGRVYLPFINPKQRLLPAEISHLEQDPLLLPFQQEIEQTVFEPGQGLPGRVLASGKSEWLADVSQDPHFSKTQSATKAGIKTGYAVPVLAQAEVAAVMVFFAREATEPEQDLAQVLDSAGRQLGLLFERKQAEQQLQHLANHDSLTGLPSVRLAMDRLTGALAVSRRNLTQAALMFVDLDGFKKVNDNLGHRAGDLLLQGVAQRLGACVREVDTVARIGGDEFLIVLTNIEGRETAETIAKKLLEVCSLPFKLDARQAQIGISIGIALYPEHGDNADQLIKKADKAMYRVKRQGKNNLLFATNDES